MDATILGVVAATLFAARGVIAVIQKETVALLTAVGGFVLAVAALIGGIAVK